MIKHLIECLRHYTMQLIKHSHSERLRNTGPAKHISNTVIIVHRNNKIIWELSICRTQEQHSPLLDMMTINNFVTKSHVTKWLYKFDGDRIKSDLCLYCTLLTEKVDITSWTAKTAFSLFPGKCERCLVSKCAALLHSRVKVSLRTSFVCFRFTFYDVCR